MIRRHLLAALAAASPLAAQDTVVVQVPGQLSALRFDRITVPVTVDMRAAGAAKLGSYAIRVSWDRTALSYHSYHDGSFAVPVVRTDSAGLGVVWLTAASPAGQDGLVHVADLVFSVGTAAADSVRVQATDLAAAATFTDLMASAVVINRGGAFCPALGRWGDLDGDGLGNSRDALAILSDIVDLPVPAGFNLALGDVDGDGLTNSRDALILLSYAVGLGIPGQRVLLVAPGPCAGGATPSLFALPDTADLAVGQQIRMMAFSRDAAGNLTAHTNLAWQTVDPAVALVDGEGNLLARQAGTTRVAAQLGPGVRIEVPVIVRAQRGTWYVDVQRAARNAVQLGTMKWPLAHPWRAFEIVAEGDTVRLAPGTYDQRDDCYYYYYCYIKAGAVILGDTLPDGTRPRLRYAGTGSNYALYFYPGVYIGGDAPRNAAGAPMAPQAARSRGEVRNLEIENFYNAIVSDGLRDLIVDNVRIAERASGYGYGVNVYEGLDTLRITRSAFIGDSAQFSYYGVYVSDGAGLAQIHDSEFRHWYYGGFYGSDVDSLDMRRNVVSQNGSTAVYSSTSYRPSISAALVENRFEDNQGDGTYIGDARTAVFLRNVHANGGDDIQVYAPYVGSGYPVPGTRLEITGDSVRHAQSGYYWLDAERFDSIRIDGVVVTGNPDSARALYGYLGANYARVSNSRFLNLYSGPPVDFFGKRLVVDNSQFIGCNVCSWDNTLGVEADDLGTGGPSVSVTNSTFEKMYRAVYVYGYGTQGGPVTLANNTVDSVSYAFDVYADSVSVSDNVLSRLRYRGLYVEPSNVNNPYTETRILRNQVSCHSTVATSGVGIRVYYNGARFEENAVRNCQYGIHVYQYSGYPMVTAASRGDTVFPRSTASPNVGIYMQERVRPMVARARVVGGYVGIDVQLTDTGSTRIDSSAVSATGYAGIRLSGGTGPATGVRNNIAGNLADGIRNDGGGTRSFTLGKFNSGGVGNGVYAVRSVAAFDATQNWWGLDTGPGGSQGTPGTAADSVNSALVSTGSFLTSEPTDVPPLAPPALGARAAAAPSGAPASTPTAVGRVDERAALEARAAAKRAAREAWKAEQAVEEAERRRVAHELRARHLRERAAAPARVRPPQ